jgi:hypothetical protein
MSQYYEPPKKADKLFSLFNESLDLWGTLDTASAIPFMRQPIIFKSHISQSKRTERKEEMRQLLKRAKSIGVLHGIIRMARNPGDQLIRNKFRWGKGHKYCTGPGSKFGHEFECFVEEAKRYCRGIYGHGRMIRCSVFCTSFS